MATVKPRSLSLSRSHFSQVDRLSIRAFQGPHPGQLLVAHHSCPIALSPPAGTATHAISAADDLHVAPPPLGPVGVTGVNLTICQLPCTGHAHRESRATLAVKLASHRPGRASLCHSMFQLAMLSRSAAGCSCSMMHFVFDCHHPAVAHRRSSALAH